MDLEFLQGISMPMVLFGMSVGVYVGSRLLRPLVGLGYPILKSCEAMKVLTHTKNSTEREAAVHELQVMNKYWVCYGLFSMSEVIFDQVLPYVIPFYYQSKLLAVVFLQCKVGEQPICVIVYDQYVSKIINEIYPITDSLLEKGSDIVLSEYGKYKATIHERMETIREDVKQRMTNFIFVRGNDDKTD